MLIGGTKGGGRRNTRDGGMKTVNGGTSSQRAAERREGREERVLCRCMQEDAADEIPQMAKCHATLNYFFT